MVFVTVGTHEQQFDRLVKAVDDLKADGTLVEPVYIQTGYSTYEPVHCAHSQFVPFRQMKSYMEGADVVITHGGPSSFIEAMAAGKVPVVVPRRGDLDEHVNNHQADFVRIVAERQGGTSCPRRLSVPVSCLTASILKAIMQSSAKSCVD